MRNAEPHPLSVFSAVCRALPFDALRMKPREKMFALLLAWESLGRGQVAGAIALNDWREVLSDWRRNEIERMLHHFKRSAWLIVDVTAQTFSLAPDRWPGWHTVGELQRLGKQSGLDLSGKDDLNDAFAKISQRCAASAHGGPPPGAKISHGGVPRPLGDVRPDRKPPDIVDDSGSLRSAGFADDGGDLQETLRIHASEFIAFKKKHKGIKPLMDFVSLREALLTVETAADEAEVYKAICGILGGVVMEGGDLGADGQERLGDGGKWRKRWRTNRFKTWRVLCSLVEEIKESRVESRGGRAENLWQSLSTATGARSAKARGGLTT